MGEPIQGHWREAWPSPFICAADLAGRDVAVTIERVERDEMVREGGKRERIAVMYLKNAQGKPLPKGMVVNATNRNTLIDLYGNTVRDWIGKSITLYPTTTKYGGKTVDAIRIRRTAPTKETA